MARLTFEQFTTNDAVQFAVARAIREEVFLVEQGVPPADEWDAYEDDATHFLMRVDGEAMGTARVRILGDVAKLERIALRKPARGKGFGEQLMQHLLAFARPQPGVTSAKLSAQTYAIMFYQKCGFTLVSAEYMDGGIPHKMMQRVLTKN
jgi:predicted GNAT family N-acyltransferase